MQPRLILLWMAMLCPVISWATGDQWLSGARARAMGGSSVVLHDLFSAANNQASYALQDTLSAGIYNERRFALSELSLYHLNIASPIKHGVAALNADYFGFSNFNETRVGLAYSKKLAPGFFMGLQANYHQLSIATVGSKSLLTVEAGILTQLNKNLWLGAHIYNPTQPQVQEFENERSPAVFRLGLGYVESNIFSVTTEVEKAIDQDANVKVGVEYYLLEGRLQARTGVTTYPASISGGFGLHWKQIQFDAAYSHQQDLGGIPGLSLQYEF